MKKNKYRKQSLESHNIDRLYIIGKILREYRELNFMSRGDIDMEYSISRSLVERAERGSNITLATFFRLCDAYNISPDELMIEVENF